MIIHYILGLTKIAIQISISYFITCEIQYIMCISTTAAIICFGNTISVSFKIWNSIIESDKETMAQTKIELYIHIISYTWITSSRCNSF